MNVYVLLGYVNGKSGELVDVYDSLLAAQSSFNDVRIEDWEFLARTHKKAWKMHAVYHKTGYNYFLIIQTEVKSK